jgi:nucleoside-diphosphate kinase
LERTLLIIKPDAVAAGRTGAILSRVENEGFAILGMERLRLSYAEAGAFYAIHKGKAFFESLLEFMTSGPIVCCALEKEYAVSQLRAVVGATDPSQAAEGTIRRLYGSNVQNNGVHASDSVENGIDEVRFFFSECTLLRP